MHTEKDFDFSVSRAPTGQTECCSRSGIENSGGQFGMDTRSKCVSTGDVRSRTMPDWSIHLKPICGLHKLETQLTYKLAMILGLANANRSSEIHALDVSYLGISNRYNFHLRRFNQDITSRKASFFVLSSSKTGQNFMSCQYSEWLSVTYQKEQTVRRISISSFSDGGQTI